MNGALRPLTEVFQPPFGTDHRVVAPIVGHVVALLVARVHAVVEVHEHHRKVLDIDHGVQCGLCRGRPGVVTEPVGHACLAGISAVTDAAVHGDRPHPDRGDRAPAREPVDHVAAQIVTPVLRPQNLFPGWIVAGLVAIGVASWWGLSCVSSSRPVEGVMWLGVVVLVGICLVAVVGLGFILAEWWEVTCR